MKSNLLKTITFILLIFFFAINIKAERVRLFTPNDGLSNSHINQIYQDSKGYIWIATDNGLNRFNGYEFEVFSSNPNDSTSIQSNYVNYVYEDSRGLFWVATSNGLLRYDCKKNSFSRWNMGDLNESLMERRANYIFEDRNNNLWICFSGTGIVRLDAKTLSPALYNRHNSGIANNTISCIFEDRHGNLWIGTEDYGVFVFNPQNYITRQFNHNPNNPTSLSNNKVFKICENAAGNIIIGTMGGGINIFDDENQNFKSLKTDKTTENMIYSLLLDKNQTVWAGTDGAGIIRYDVYGNKTSFWEEASSVCDLRTAKVHDLFQDKQGNIWASLYQMGVIFISATGSYFQNIGFNPFDVSKSIGTHCIISIIEDSQENVWVGTDGNGLYMIQTSGKILHFTSENTNGFKDNVITAIFESRDKNIWIGTYMNGFFRYNTHTGKFDSHYQKTNPDNGLSYNHVTSFSQDCDGNIWIGTNGGGISVFNPITNQFKRYMFFADDEKNQISGNWIYDVLIDSEKGVWVATSNGLNYLNKEKDIFEIVVLADGDTKISNIMYSLHEDYKGNIWIGSYHGLHRLDKTTGKPFLITTDDGLPNNMITGIEEDSENNLWISTGKGLCYYNPERSEFINFYAHDGIQSNEFRRGSHFKGKNDKMYFGGINGITTFYPSGFSRENPLLELVFTDLLVNNEPVRIGQSDILEKSLDETASIRLKYNQRSFTFRFAALEFGMPQRVNYYTLMEHFDEQWHQLESSNRSVTYTNLNPGFYVFKVKATIDGIHTLQKDMQVVILPPWWLSLTAKMSYVIVFILLIYSIYSYISHRLRQRRELMEKEQQKQISESKLHFFTDISHEIRTPLSLIIAPLEKMIENGNGDPAMRSSFRIMYQNAIRILRMINQLMDLRALDNGKLKLKIEQVDILKFIHNIMDSFTDLANARQISFTMKSEDGLPPVFIDMDCLDKIIFNLLSNAFKFTPQGGSVLVDVQSEEQEKDGMTLCWLSISVQDSGIGITKEQHENIFDRFYQVPNGKPNVGMGKGIGGIGLHLSKMMAELHHGSLKVESEPEKGSKFTVSIPLTMGHEPLSNDTIYKADEYGSESEQTPVTMFQPSVYVINDKKDEGKTDKRKKNGQKSVLLVEDDLDILNYMKSELSTDYHIYTANNGKEGLTKALQYLPDIIVSDILMPEMNGLLLCKLIKTNETTCHIPVILLTAKTSIEQRIEGIEAGADSYIPKPFNIKHLQTRIEKLIKLRDTLKQKYSGELDVAEDDIKVITSDEKLLNRLNYILNTQLNNPDLSIEIISKELGVSKVQLHRRLKVLTNETPGNYIRNFRLKHAAWLLVNKNMTISEIAYSVGFSSLAYFSAIFKVHYGMSPKEYVETNKLV